MFYEWSWYHGDCFLRWWLFSSVVCCCWFRLFLVSVLRVWLELFRVVMTLVLSKLGGMFKPLVVFWLVLLFWELCLGLFSFFCVACVCCLGSVHLCQLYLCIFFLSLPVCLDCVVINFADSKVNKTSSCWAVNVKWEHCVDFEQLM